MDISKNLVFDILTSDADYFPETKSIIFPQEALQHVNDYADFKNTNYSYNFDKKSIINDFEVYYYFFTYLLSSFKSDKKTFIKNQKNIYKYFLMYYFSEISLIDSFEKKFEKNVLEVTEKQILKKIHNIVDENTQPKLFLKFSRDNNYFYENSDEEIIKIFNELFSYNEYINLFSSNIISVIECFLIIDNQLFNSRYSTFADDTLLKLRTEFSNLDDFLIIDDFKLFQDESVNNHNQRLFNF